MKAHQTILQIKHAAVTFGLSLLAASLYAGTQGSYVNNGNIHSPPLPIPQIDATNFVNNGTFYVLTLDNFEFSNTENYTNRSVLTATGFRFDTAPSAAATTGINARHRAKTFLNGTLTTPISSYNSAISASGLISVNASNVVNRGIMSVGSAGQVHIEGNNLDLQRGFLQTSGMGSQQGMAMDYWANANAANAKFNPAQDFNTNNPTAGVASHGTNAATPYQYYTPGDFTWGRGGGEIFARQFVNARKISGTNAQVSVNAVFVRVADTNNATVKIVGEQKGFNDVTPGDLGVELAVVATNAFGTAVTNYFSVLDTMGLFRTNKFKKFPPGTNVTTAIAYGGLFYRPVYFSTNYTIERAPLTLFGTDGTPIQRYLDDTNFVPFSQTNSVVLGTNNLAITNVISVVTNILPFLVGTNGIISGNTNFFVVDTMYFGTNSATRTNRLVPGNRNFNVTSFATVNGTNQSVTIRNDLEIVSDGDVSFFITNTFSRGSEITNTFMTIAPYFNITNVFAGTNVVISNFVCTAAGLTLDNTTYRPNPPASISNLVGSVDISAEQSLNLNYSRISAVNYVKIEALSGFKGSSNAIISTPFCDVRLAATNGSLVVSNLLASAPPTLVGTVDIYSVFWTNQVVNIPSLNTNASPVETHVMLVDLQLTTSTNAVLLSFDLKASNGGGTGSGTGVGAGSGAGSGAGGGTYIGCSSNANPTTITIDDTYYTTNSFTADADNFRIGYNGNLTLDVAGFTWAAELPYVHAFTNDGILKGGASTIGFQLFSHYCDDSPRPYDIIVNNGFIQRCGSFEASALRFENYGLIASTNGAVSIISSNIILDGHLGEIDSSLADVSIGAGHLAATNHLIVSDRALNLWITNSLEDGGNTFYVEDGFNLYQKPFLGDFNASVFFSTAFDYAEVHHSWAGVDYGPVDAGFTNNAAMGNLDLKGGVFSVFVFEPVGISNALYVDQLDLNGTSGDLDANGNLGNIRLQPGMKIYYASAYTNRVAVDLTGKFGSDGAAGGGFVPVAHSGLFPRSGAGGSVIKALTHGQGMDVKVASIHGSAGKASISWNTVAGSINTVYYKNSMTDATWRVLKTFTAQNGGRTAVNDTVGSSARFYKVELNLANP